MVLVLVSILLMTPMVGPMSSLIGMTTVHAVSIWCEWAGYNRIYAVMCFWELMTDFWDPYDWEDPVPG